jgi:putative ABC transport system permease protein
MNHIGKDLRYAVRSLVKNPAFTAVAVLALALGIGVNSAIFSLIDATLLRPLPYTELDRVMVFWESNLQSGAEQLNPSPADFADYKNQNQVFEHIAAFLEGNLTITNGDAPERIWGVDATADLFQVLGVKPILGRTFRPEEEQPGNDNVVVLGYDLWRRSFNANPAIIGTQLTVNNQINTVIGVMPPGFTFPPGGQKVEMWTPLSLRPEQANSRRGPFLSVIALLKKGVSRDQAEAQMNNVARRIEQQYPDTNTGKGVRLKSLVDVLAAPFRTTLIIMFGAVIFVLVLACANVANLLLARATVREKEVALRTALGASRWRLIQQLLLESALLAVLGGVLGVLLAHIGLKLFVAGIPDWIINSLPRLREVGIDGRMLIFTLVVSLVTAMAFGLAPALSASKQDLNQALKEGGQKATGGLRGYRLRKILVVSEVALALVLLVGAGLMIKSFLVLSRVDPGFQPQNMLTMQMSLPRRKYPEVQQAGAFYQSLIEKLEALPGVQSVGAVNNLPLGINSNASSFTIDGRPAERPGEQPMAFFDAISPSYFRTMGIQLLKGRNITTQDFATGAPVVVISEAMALRSWPNEEALGKRISIGGEPFTREIVGVVADIKHSRLDAKPEPEMYISYLQNPEQIVPARTMSVVVKTASDPLSAISAIRQTVLSLDKEQPVYNIRTMESIVADSIYPQRLPMILLGAFGFIALVLAMMGIYAVISYTVTQRTHEIGIRMALGARRRNVITLLLRQGLGLTLIGVVIGLLCAFAVMRVLSGLLFGVSAADPVIFLLIALLLCIVALIASLIPAGRVTKVDPMIALRYQ